jgi:hypothetical protein
LEQKFLDRVRSAIAELADALYDASRVEPLAIVVSYGNEDLILIDARDGATTGYDVVLRRDDALRTALSAIADAVENEPKNLP